MKIRTKRIALVAIVFALGYVLGGLSLSESMARGQDKVKVTGYFDNYISMEIHTPVKIKNVARKSFIQQGDKKWLFAIWYNQ